MKITLDYRFLLAAILFSAKKDVRHYLNGAALDLENGAVVATDGHRLMRKTGAFEPLCQQDLIQLGAEYKKYIVIKNDDVKTIIKAAKKNKQAKEFTVLELSKKNDDTVCLKYAIGNEEYSFDCDIGYTLVSKVAPADLKENEDYKKDLFSEDDYLAINGDYMLDFIEACKLFNKKPNLIIRKKSTLDNKALYMVDNYSGIEAIIMPTKIAKPEMAAHDYCQMNTKDK